MNPNFLFVLLLFIVSFHGNAMYQDPIKKDTKEVFLVGEDIVFNGVKVPANFSSLQPFEDYASDAEGNISFFNITWKEQGDNVVKSVDIIDNDMKELLGFESSWKKSKDFHIPYQQQTAINDHNICEAYAQRGHCIGWSIVDKLGAKNVSYNLRKNSQTSPIEIEEFDYYAKQKKWSVFNLFSLPYNFT